MKYGNGWLRLHNRIPFRTTYLYWNIENEDRYIIDAEMFATAGVKVRFWKRGFSHPEYPKVTGVLISCWEKDAITVERCLDLLDSLLMQNCDEYKEFLKFWKNGTKDFLK